MSDRNKKKGVSDRNIKGVSDRNRKKGVSDRNIKGMSDRNKKKKGMSDRNIKGMSDGNKNSPCYHHVETTNHQEKFFFLEKSDTI